MATALPILRFLLLASLVLAESAHMARAEAVGAGLRVSAEIVVACRLDASVPRVGTPERRNGSARFGVSCTQGAVAAAMACPEACTEAKVPAPRARHELAAPRGGGAAIIATVFF